MALISAIMYLCGIHDSTLQMPQEAQGGEHQEQGRRGDVGTRVRACTGRTEKERGRNMSRWMETRKVRITIGAGGGGETIEMERNRAYKDTVVATQENEAYGYIQRPEGLTTILAAGVSYHSYIHLYFFVQK